MSQDAYGTPPPVDTVPGNAVTHSSPDGPARISQACFVTWSRFDPRGLAAHKEARGGLVVRVAAPRQRWPNRTMSD